MADDKKPKQKDDATDPEASKKVAPAKSNPPDENDINRRADEVIAQVEADACAANLAPAQESALPPVAFNLPLEGNRRPLVWAGAILLVILFGIIIWWLYNSTDGTRTRLDKLEMQVGDLITIGENFGTRLKAVEEGTTANAEAIEVLKATSVTAAEERLKNAGDITGLTAVVERTRLDMATKADVAGARREVNGLKDSMTKSIDSLHRANKEALAKIDVERQEREASDSSLRKTVAANAIQVNQKLETIKLSIEDLGKQIRDGVASTGATNPGTGQNNSTLFAVDCSEIVRKKKGRLFGLITIYSQEMRTTPLGACLELANP